MATRSSKRLQKRECNEAATSQGRNKRQKISAGTLDHKPAAFTKNTIADANEMLGDGKPSPKIKYFNVKVLCHPEQADDDLKKKFIELWDRRVRKSGMKPLRPCCCTNLSDSMRYSINRSILFCTRSSRWTRHLISAINETLPRPKP
jgi:hypothetical protein